MGALLDDSRGRRADARLRGDRQVPRAQPPSTHVTDADIVLFVDDDVAIGPEFVPRYLAAVEALGPSLAQPALSLGSYYSHQITRRQSDRWLRLTNFVEIGPIFSMTRELLDLVTPFPESNPMGWGLEAHWSSVVRERGLKMGIVDACPVEHSFRPVNSTYLADQARRDMCEYLKNYRFVWHPMETHRNFIAIPTTREEYLHCYPAPPEAVGHAEGGDSEADLPLLWAVASLVRPRTTLELGTRWGEGTRVLAHAAARWGGRVVTVDPCDAQPHLNGVNCEFVQARGEDYFRQWDAPVDLLFIDTDPHTYDQTRHWLETWVAGCAGPRRRGGLPRHRRGPARDPGRRGGARLGWRAARRLAVAGIPRDLGPRPALEDH